MLYSQRLKIVRLENKLTQDQVAKVLGVTRSAYCGYETGRRTPTLDAIVALSNFYQLPLEVFMGETQMNEVHDESFYEANTDVRYLSQLSKEEADIIVNYRIATEEGKAEIAEASRTAQKDR